MFVSPRRNHRSSWMMERVWSFFVVSSGKPSLRSSRNCRPNTLNVPVPVRSALLLPFSYTSLRRSRYCFIGREKRKEDAYHRTRELSNLQEQSQYLLTTPNHLQLYGRNGAPLLVLSLTKEGVKGKALLRSSVPTSRLRILVGADEEAQSREE